ncbi:uncharacterized protein [Oscarella lobularis]|uniref:uncharacterized protein n=1 Tax=Oscarella lobularis TaxID=121494 RepID=UPI00331309D4
MGHLQRDVADILAPLLDAKMVLIKGKLVGRPYSMDGSRRWGSRVYDCRCSILSGHSKWTREDFQKVYKEMSDSGFSPKWDEYETSDYKSDHWIDDVSSESRDSEMSISILTGNPCSDKEKDFSFDISKRKRPAMDLVSGRETHNKHPHFPGQEEPSLQSPDELSVSILTGKRVCTDRLAQKDEN